MFKIECYCEDRLLPAALHALAGKVMDVKATPVINALSANGHLQARTSGDVVELFRAWVAKHKIKLVTPDVVRQFQSDHGRSATSYSVVLATVLKAGVLKKRGKGSAKYTYDVQPATKGA